jgi:small subunit ribosomal protein S27Ae
MAREAPKPAAPAPAKTGPVPTKPVPGKGVPAAPEAPVEKVKEKKEKKSQKERPHSKKKHTKVQIWKLYDVKGGTLHRKNEHCPRCGSGTFLAKYKARKYCGKCGWSHIQGKE